MNSKLNGMMKKVLVVEDNDLNLKLFYDLLVIHNCEVIMSRDGVGVVELTKQEKPDLILMDIQLNGVSGIDLIQSLKTCDITSHIPIIAVTAFAMKNDETRILDSGCDLYLTKPISIDHFVKAINTFLTPVYET